MPTEILTKDDLNSFKIELFKELSNFISTKSPTQKEWLRSSDVRKMLGISAGTLQTLRINGTLPYSKIGGSMYYSYADVVKVLEKNKVAK